MTFLLTSTQSPSAKTEKGKAPLEDVGGETSKRLPQDHEEYFSNAEGSDSDDPFDSVNKKLSVSSKQTTSSSGLVMSSEDASLTSIRGAIQALELLMVKDLSELSSDPALQSQLDHYLDLLSTSNHPKVTIEVREAFFEFKTKAFASFKEFQATIESVNKLKNFEKQKARIQQETNSGKDRWKDIRNSIQKVRSTIEVENNRKKEIEAEIATLRKQLAMKESDLEQVVLNVKNQEDVLSNYSTTFDSLNEQARALSKEANDLVTANIGVQEEGEAAESKQSKLKLTWSTDLASQFTRIKNTILGRYE